MVTVYVLLVFLHRLATAGSVSYFIFTAARTRNRFFVTLAIVVCVQYVAVGMAMGAPAHTFVLWYLNIALLIYCWWKMRPPRKRRKLREIAKAKFRKMAVRIPRPLAPTPVGT